MRIAWFSPLPPDRSGIAAYSAELLPQLAERDLTIDPFTEHTARDFVWQQRRRPYDLTVYQLGNAACHDYMWAYLFRYPGLVALHDAQLHQARALFLTRRWQPRRDDYLAEFHANHPEAPPDAGELVAAGHGGTLYQHWPMIRLVVERARLTIVHSRWLLDDLREAYPGARIEHVEMGVSDPLAHADESRRADLAPEGSTVVAAFGGITPEKRIPTIIRALSAVADRHPSLHLALVGGAAPHYNAMDDARTWGVDDRVHLTGYVPDEALPAYLAAADVCVCLRWPTNRETSASWLRCLAVGRPTIVTDLAHLGEVPTIDPRGWRRLDTVWPPRAPVAVSVDLMDEQHSLELALERLATDRALRSSLAEEGRRWWARHHQIDAMADRYAKVLAIARDSPAGRANLPRHLLDDGSDRGRAIAARLGIASHVAAVLEP